MLHGEKAAKTITDKEMVDIYKTEGFKVDSERYTTMLFFMFLMQRGENIMFASNGY